MSLVTIDTFRGDVANALPGELDGIHGDACRAMMMGWLKPSEVDEIARLIAERRHSVAVATKQGNAIDMSDVESNAAQGRTGGKRRKSAKVDTRQKSLFG
jgi:hypothetical protein